MVKVSGAKFLIIIFALFFAGNITVAFSQGDGINKKISIIAENEKLTSVIQRLSNLSEINFSYNSKLITEDVTTTVRVKNESINSILQQLLDEHNLKFRFINSQIIVYLPSEKELIKKSIVEINYTTVVKKKTVSPPKQEQKLIVYDTLRTLVYDTMQSVVYDTLQSIVYDTLQSIVYDTLQSIVYDTLLTTIYDTVKDEEASFNKLEKNWQFSLGGSYFSHTNEIIKPINLEQEYYAEILKQSESPYQNLSGELTARYCLSNFFIQSGISLRRNENTFSHTATHETVDFSAFDVTDKSFWEIYAADSFYEYAGTDTTWIQILDSNFVSQYDTLYGLKDSFAVHSDINTSIYFEIPIVTGYCFRFGEKLSISIGGGIIAGIHIKTKGSQVNRKEYPLFFFTGNAGVEYALSKHFGVSGRYVFRKQLNSVYNKDYPVSKRINYSGFNAGLVYHL